MPSVDIVIVNWNAGSQLADCIRSIAGADHDGVVINNVIVVDNASNDHSIDLLPNTDLPLDLIQNSCNRGFAAACNQGANATRGDAEYILFLNPDTRLSKASLQQPILFMEGVSKEIGICGVKMVDNDGTAVASCANFPTARSFLGKWLTRPLPGMFPYFMLTENELASSRLVDVVIGAFFLVRRDLYVELKGFDERFFVYFEEADFALRAQRQGFYSYYLADVRTFHQGGACSDNAPAERLYYFWRSSMKYAMKHFSLGGKISASLATLMVEPAARLLQALKNRSFVNFKTVINAYRLLLLDLISDKAK